MIRRLALACGGTLGHVTPALVIADAWAAAHPEAPPLLVTVKGDPPIPSVRAAGHEQFELPSAPFARSTPGARLAACFEVARGLREARSRLRDDVGAALSFGGYAGVTLMLAARSLGLTSLAHEGNAFPGLGNRLAVELGAIPLAASPDMAAQWPSSRLVGFPVRPAPYLAQFPRGGGIDVVVTGGSSGSPDVNRLAPRLLAAAKLRARLRILHQCGDDSAVQAVKRAYEAHALDATVLPFIDNLPAVLAQASFALACPGAATLAELAAAALPALLIPRPDVARRHQHANADMVARAGAALVLDQSLHDLNATGAAIAETLLDERRWTELSQAMNKLHRPESAHLIVETIEAAMERQTFVLSALPL